MAFTFEDLRELAEGGSITVADWNRARQNFQFLQALAGNGENLPGATVQELYQLVVGAGEGAKNLVYNGIYELYSNRIVGASNWYDYKHPDGWIYTDDGSDGKIGYDSVNECCKIVTSSDGTAMSLSQGLHEFLRWAGALKGKQVTVRLSIKGSSNITCRLYDGVSTITETLTGAGAIENIDLQIDVSGSATGLWVDVITAEKSETIELYDCYGNVGPDALPGLPCQIERIGLWQGMDEAYPETVMECSAAASLIEIPAGYTRLESWLNGRFGRGGNSRSYLPELRGRFLRVWANGSTKDPDRATRTNRGDGTTGDKVGTLQVNQNLRHNHTVYGTHDNSYIGSLVKVFGSNTNNANGHLNCDSGGGNQSNPENINVLAGIRWA